MVTSWQNTEELGRKKGVWPFCTFIGKNFERKKGHVNAILIKSNLFSTLLKYSASRRRATSSGPEFELISDKGIEDFFNAI